MVITDNYRGALSFSWFKDNEQKIDLCPENYQRCFVWDISKQKELLRTLFDNKPGLIPEVHVRNYVTPINTTKKNGIIAEVMDGQQRITTLFRFLRNELKTPSDLEFEQSDGQPVNISDKFINELPTEAYDFFVNYSLQVAFYTDITDAEAADIFKNKLNSGKPLSKAEKRNAHNTEIARYVRNVARLGNGKYGRHELFDVVPGTKCETAFKHFDEKSFVYSEYSADVLIASICVMIYDNHKFYNPAIDVDLERLYTNKDFKDRFAYEKRVKTVLDTLKNLITSTNGQTYKKFWNLSNLKYLVRVWLCLDVEHSLKIDYPETFIKKYIALVIKLSEADAEERKKGMKKSFFYSCVVRQKSVDTVTYAVNTLSDIIAQSSPMEYGLSNKNTSNRCFSKEDILKKHLEQEGICPICKEPMSIDDAQGGHKLSYKDGGTVTYDNLVVLHGRCNRLMGTEEYKDGNG